MSEFLTARSAATWLRKQYPKEHTPSHVTLRAAILNNRLISVQIPIGDGSRTLFILDSEDVKTWWSMWRKLRHRGPQPGGKRGKK